MADGACNRAERLQAAGPAGHVGRRRSGRGLSGPDRIWGLYVTAPLPSLLGGTELIAWRLDAKKFAPTWDSGEGAYRFGGRWSSPGTRAVYCSLDASTTILEVAVHRGFR